MIRGDRFLLTLLAIFILPFFAHGAKYYSYKTGNWSDISTWTHDPSGTLQNSITVPSDNDEIYILSGKKVNLDSDISTENLKITINAGAILNIDTYEFINPLEDLKGVGTLQLSSTDFPTINGDNSFIKSGGGTTEYLNSSDFTFVQTEYNNLTISINNSATAMQLDDLQINGKLHIKSGTFQISDNSTVTEAGNTVRYNLTVNGDVEVDNLATLKVGTHRTTASGPSGISGATNAPYHNYYSGHSHIVIFKGNLTNNGTVRFTNMPYPIYNKFPTIDNETGIATVYFEGATNNTITANGTTDFYNLVVNKGNNQSYKLTVYSSNYQNFKIFGANSEGAISPGTSANPVMRKALWIRNGTLEFTGQVVIPSLSEGGGAPTGKAHFVIPQNGALVLNGPDVIIMSTADDYRELRAAYNITDEKAKNNSSVGINYPIAEGGILVHGKLQVDDGYLSTRESSGILYPDKHSVGEVVINGGKVETKQFAPFAEDEGLVNYTQTGGIFELRGRYKRITNKYENILSPEDLVLFGYENVYYYGPFKPDVGLTKEELGTFTLISSSNVFNMSGGNLNIHAQSDNVNNSPTRGLGILINANPENSNVTGGTVRIEQIAGTVYIKSNAPLGNLQLDKSSSSNNFVLSHPLTVINDLEILNGKLDTEGYDVTVGGDLLTGGTSSYVHKENTLTFNGSGNQTFTVRNHIYNLNIDKNDGQLFINKTSSGQLYIRGSLNILKGTLNDGGHNLQIEKNVTNSGSHIGTGCIVMFPQTPGDSSIPQHPQTIGGDGTGSFTNLRFQNKAGVSLTASTTILGDLNFHTGAPLYIDKYNITFGPDATQNYLGSTKNFFKTNGNYGDGGVTFTYTDPSSQTFNIALGER